MNRERSLRKNGDFIHVYQGGSYAHTSDFTLFARENGREGSRYGFSLSRKFGKAVERNRAKRQLKNITDQNQEKFPAGYDYIIIPKPSIKKETYQEVESSLLFCLQKWIDYQSHKKARQKREKEESESRRRKDGGANE